jgi:uncharacterized protein YjbJ (UPF0337 family)
MNQEQFKSFWIQLKAPLKAKWEKITDADLLEIEGSLATFTAVLVKRYGAIQNGEVRELYKCLRGSSEGSVTNCAVNGPDVQACTRRVRQQEC